MHVRRNILAMALVAAATLAAAVPCDARGTGGWLREWVACGPLEGAQLDKPDLGPDFAAYPGLFAAGKVWLPVETEPGGRLDIVALYPKTDIGVALFHTYFEIPADATYRLRVGSDDAVRIEIDGRVVHRNDVHRAWQADQDNVPVHLAKGWHRMLVRVVNYGGAWAMSVRLADAKDQPVDVRQQAAAPESFHRLCGLSEPSTMGERADATVFLTAEIAQFQGELATSIRRLAVMPEGYVTFAEYEGARAQGLKFLEAMAVFWREAGNDEWDFEALHEAHRGAVLASRSFSEVLAADAEKMGTAVVRAHRVWEMLGGEAATRREVAASILSMAELLAQARQLAARVETERVQVARFENDIRNWRQRDVTVRVRDAEGGLVPDADVEIVQTRHDFLFGCNLFALGRWEDAKKNALYEKRFRDLFNLAVVPTYWSVLEKFRNRDEFEPIDNALHWCQENHIQVRVHPVVWSETFPRWLEDLTPSQASSALETHVRQIVDRYRDTVEWWDVVHQPRAEMRVGPAAVDPAEPLRWAYETKPRGGLLVSGPDTAALAELARRMRGGNVKLDGVAPSAQQYEGAWPVDLIRKKLAEAAAAELPIHVSELAILGDQESEAEQAEAVRHFYTAAFAHPRVASITWWDLSDRFAWKNAPAGLLRADLSSKPAYKVLDRLINHLWRTDAAGRTDGEGQVTVRAFFGQYKITARQGKRKTTVEVHVGREGPSQFEVVLPPAK